MNIKIIKEDVSISEIETPVCDGPSESCTVFPTHGVWLDLRVIGENRELGKYCETCAKELTEQLASSLPSDESEDDDRDAARDAATLDEAIELLKRGTKTLTDLASLSNVNTETRRLLVTVAEAFGQFTLKHERAVKK